MHLTKVLAQLREELENLDAAILSLERLQQESRRGGKAKSLVHPVHLDDKERGPASEEDES